MAVPPLFPFSFGLEETLLFNRSMAPNKLKQAFGAVKDRTAIGLAKVASTSTLADLDVAIVKATRHDHFPAEDKYIRDILALTCYSRLHINSCISTLAKRLNKTKNWIVALKTLMLIHRLLVEGDPACEEEIFFSLRRGTRFLNMSDFCDNSRSDSWDYSAFVRTFALYLDGWLEYRMECRRARRRMTHLSDDVAEKLPELPRPGFKAVPVQEMDSAELFCRMHILQQLLQRFLACRPIGGANKHRLVMVSLILVIKESFRIYSEIVEIRDIFLERFTSMEVSNTIKVHDIFVRMQEQFDELDVFYKWSKVIGIVGTTEYPEVERITQKQLDDLNISKYDKSGNVQCNKDLLLLEGKRPINGVGDPVQDTEAKKGNSQQEVDLLNLDDAYDGCENKPAGNEAYAIISVLNPSPPKQDDNFNWETALVESTSNQTPNPRGGSFDMRFLDRMYEEGAAAIYGGSYESSVNVVPGIPLGYDTSSLLSLPTQCQLDTNSIVVGELDPFAYNNMEKQKVLMWPQTYSAGDAAMAPHPYQMGIINYTRN